MMKVWRLFLLLALLSPSITLAQEGPEDLMDDDIAMDGDIFNDFNEDIEATQVLEDERFYRYGRFFQACVGLGATTFTGNRGAAYEDNHPTFHVSTVFFLSFQAAVFVGVEYSKHTMFIDTVVNGYQNQILGAVETSFLRPFAGFRYYMDTTDLGTAITYSNPYFISRLEYWYQNNKFPELPTVPEQEGGGIGLGIGGGLEFPIEIKKSYISVEALYHRVNYFDRFTRDYQQVPTDADSKYGYDDLTGDAISLKMTYNFTW